MGVVVPVCGRFKQRIEDFKKYGLVNTGERKVLLNLLLSNEDLSGIESGWDKNIDVNVVKSECPNYVSNIYRFYAQIDPEKIEYKWLMRVDDDSCTDIDGLASNLEEFYDWRENLYLGSSLQNFSITLEGKEGELYPEYSHALGNYERISRLLKNEVECGIISASALAKILNNEQSSRLIKFRARFYGGYGDCVTALAAAMAKVHPIDCPFISHLPSLDNFSLAGGILNHIHMISRNTDGENFTWDRASNEQFVLLTKIIEKKPTETEKMLEGSRFLLDTSDALTTYKFKPGYLLNAKFEDHNFMWMEHNKLIHVFNRNELIHRFSMGTDGTLSDGRTGMSERLP